MKTIFAKAIVALLSAALVPVILFFAIGVVVMCAAVSLPELLSRLIEFLRNVAFWGFISLILPLPISFAHLLFLGIPAFIIGWWFRAIRWWSVLVTSFLIGAVPIGIFFFIREFEWPAGFDLITSMEIILIGSSVIFIVAGVMGLFGASGGLAFWLIWRYWASPDSPIGRPLSSLEANEQSTWNLSEKTPNTAWSNCLESQEQNHFSGWTASPSPRDGAGKASSLAIFTISPRG